MRVRRTDLGRLRPPQLATSFVFRISTPFLAEDERVITGPSTHNRKHDAERVAFACGITVLIVVLVFYSLRRADRLPIAAERLAPA